MASAWYLVPYSTTIGGIGRAVRTLDIDRFTSQILAAGGAWAEIEVLGDHALVKVRGVSEQDLAALNGVPGYTRMPDAWGWDTTLSELTVNQRTALRDRIVALGYPLAELQAALGNDIGQVTLRQVLRFIARRRVSPRWNGSAVVFDGPIVVPELPDALEARFPG